MDNPHFQLWLFQSRYRAASHFRRITGNLDKLKIQVSISLSSGFSFQVWVRVRSSRRSLVSISLSSGFSFQAVAAVRLASARHVSISLSSGFSFQAIAATKRGCASLSSFNLVIERLLISGPSSRQFWQTCLSSFNLVIERLLISGGGRRWQLRPRTSVSISLSSGFSFQETLSRYRLHSLPSLCFNLVIERLLISGKGMQ